MASYKDYLNVQNINKMSISELRIAVRKMSDAANKRLKRFSERGITYGDSIGSDTISGVRKFSTKGLDIDGLRDEFKRVRNFIMSPQSSLTAMKRVYKEFKQEIKRHRRLNKREKKEYEKMKKQQQSMGIDIDSVSQWDELQMWRETWTYYNKLVEQGHYTPSSADSNQVRDTVLAAIKSKYEYNLSDMETWEQILNNLQYDYENIKEDDEYNDVSVSSFFSYGSSN